MAQRTTVTTSNSFRIYVQCEACNHRFSYEQLIKTNASGNTGVLDPGRTTPAHNLSRLYNRVN